MLRSSGSSLSCAADIAVFILTVGPVRSPSAVRVIAWSKVPRILASWDGSLSHRRDCRPAHVASRGHRSRVAWRLRP
jgi:hypothetical protein